MQQTHHLHKNHTLKQGSYCIDHVLGEGGFGITYLATQNMLERKVAVKEFYLSGYCTRDTQHKGISVQKISFDDFSKYRQRFIEEAKLLAKLNHPGIVRVIDIFEENNTAYFVMEYVEGNSLMQLVRKHGTLPQEKVINYTCQLLEALEVVHKTGMLHRDIKPDNILVTPDDKVVLIDFGSAREFAEGTISHSVILTPGYAPPEQYSSRAHRGPFTDIYSVGATMYFCLTGQKPDSAPDRTQPGMDDSLQLASHFNSSISKELDSIISNALQINAKHRYASADLMFNELLGVKNFENKGVVERTIKVQLPEDEKTVVFVKKKNDIPKATLINSNNKSLFIERAFTYIPFLGLVIVILVIALNYKNNKHENNSTDSTSLKIEVKPNASIESPKSSETKAEPNVISENANEGSNNTFKKNESFQSFTDSRDGNVYKTVTIGEQVWMAENLRYLPEVSSPSEGSETAPHYYVYDYKVNSLTEAKGSKNYKTYGVLYNWPAAIQESSSSSSNPSGIQGVCPSGWHLPSKEEWNELDDYTGDETGGKLKEIGTSHWNEPNKCASDSFGFKALPGGDRYGEGIFGNKGIKAYYWSATKNSSTSAYYSYLDYNNCLIDIYYRSTRSGFSVRCLKD